MPGKTGQSREKAKSEKAKSGKAKSVTAKSRKGELLKLLANAAKDLDEEGLEFILNQANVLIYNMQVEKLNERMTKAKSAGRGEGKKGTPGSPGKSGEAAARAGVQGVGEVEIVEKEESGNFFIVVNNFRILFTREEMRSLVKICHASADAGDASNRLFNWFERNRKDLLIDGGIVSRTHPALESVYEILIKRYKVKGEG
jgi:hypothetical protein